MYQSCEVDVRGKSGALSGLDGWFGVWAEVSGALIVVTARAPFEGHPPLRSCVRDFG